MSEFKVLIVGLGVQGKKRLKIAGSDAVACIDPNKTEADFNKISEAPLDSYNAALVCTPDDTKYEILEYLLSNKKHVLVEKPLWAPNIKQLNKLENISISNHVICYTAYNHRYEPHFVRMRDLIRSERLGNIYSCRMFYGNGTARLVRDSEWRDRGKGVLSDLGSHLLDTCNFWFGTRNNDFKITSINNFENKSPDHAIISSETTTPRIELEMTLLMWKNFFTCDILAENGSAHIESLCKWGPSKFIFRKRVLPSGIPKEDSTTIIKEDPTWYYEYNHFKELCNNPGNITNLDKDIWIQSTLNNL